MTKKEALIQEALRRLDDVERFRKSDTYKLLFDPLKEEIESLKHAYACKTTEEIAALKGRYEGLTFLTDLIEKIVQEGEIAREQAAQIERRKNLEAMELDSTDL